MLKIDQSHGQVISLEFGMDLELQADLILSLL